MNKLPIYNVLKSVGAIILLVILYLFALNGRYERIGYANNAFTLDKWTGKVYVIKYNDMNSSCKFVEIGK